MEVVDDAKSGPMITRTSAPAVDATGRDPGIGKGDFFSWRKVAIAAALDSKPGA